MQDKFNRIEGQDGGDEMNVGWKEASATDPEAIVLQPMAKSSLPRD